MAVKFGQQRLGRCGKFGIQINRRRGGIAVLQQAEAAFRRRGTGLQLINLRAQRIALALQALDFDGRVRRGQRTLIAVGTHRRRHAIAAEPQRNRQQQEQAKRNNQAAAAE
ncbi:MAG: hypothetical protein ACFB3T_12890 [Geminicoccaceae bacterium]